MMRKNQGYVYVLGNPSMPGLVKIGRSIHGGRTRAKELYQTGVPTPFELKFEILVDDPSDVETLTHGRLTDYRVSDSREFFRVHIDDAIEAVISVVLSLNDQLICHAAAYEAVEGGLLMAHKTGLATPDVWEAVGWLEPEDIRRAHERRMAAIKKHTPQRAMETIE